MRRIGELLLEEGLITPEQLRRALDEQRGSTEKLGAILVRLGHLSEEQLVSVLSRQYGIGTVNLAKHRPDPEVLSLLPSELARRHQVLPLALEGKTLVLGTADPTNVLAIDDVRFLTGFQVRPVLATPSAVRQTIERWYDRASDLQDMVKKMGEAGIEVIAGEPKVDVAALQESAEDAPTIKLVNLIIADAIGKRASDIHLEPYEKIFRVRYRMDGVLHDIMTPPKQMEAATLSRVKIMAKMDIAERRLPQDGRIEIRFQGREVDLRVSSLPTIFGEKIVLRILDKTGQILDLAKLGFEGDSLERFREAISKPHGMVLVTGPTGSGKTTTLYAAISAVNSPEVNIMTAEDPVEYNIPGINQVHIREEIGLTFSAALRSFLRQDPDVILVGEMRDTETAQIAVRAALTGHLVFSTVHTNDAPSTIARLLDMGLPPFLVSSSVLMVIAQRLVRRICLECREPLPSPSPQALLDVGFSPEMADKVTCYMGKGCSACAQTGYRGRAALYEVMPITPTIRDLVLRQRPAGEIKEAAVKEGMKTLRQVGLEKVAAGITSLNEVLRVTLVD